MIKNTCSNTVKNIRATLFFRASACKLLKNSECKKYIPYSRNNSGQLCFFRASASCSKIMNSEKNFNTVYIHLGAIRAICASVVCNLDQSHEWLHGRNLVGDTGDVSPTFSGGGDIICHVPHFFLLRWCIWRGFKNKSNACHVLCKELFKLDGRLYIAKFMFKQSLVWYH